MEWSRGAIEPSAFCIAPESFVSTQADMQARAPPHIYSTHVKTAIHVCVCVCVCVYGRMGVGDCVYMDGQPPSLRLLLILHSPLLPCLKAHDAAALRVSACAFGEARRMQGPSYSTQAHTHSHTHTHKDIDAKTQRHKDTKK